MNNALVIKHNIPYSGSVTPMENVSKYGQNLGMDIHNNENLWGVVKKKGPEFAYSHFSIMM